MTTPRELRLLYEQGKNIAAHLREEQGLQRNTAEIIEIAYDLQAGSYVAAMKKAATARHKKDYTAELARIVLALGRPASVLEAGVGEATTLSGVLQNLGTGVRSFGFDLSWSRLAFARRWLEDHGLRGTTLCTGNLLQIPFADDAVDVVYTSHSIEPNGGNEEPILRELYRVARKYLVLLEPGYELADDEARRRMDAHGYCKNLRASAESLGYRVLRHELFPFSVNARNPTAITIIEKTGDARPPGHVLACPRLRTPLERVGNMLFSPESLVAYPIVGGIPCLRVENGILASRYKEFVTTR